MLPDSQRRYLHSDVLAVYDSQLRASATGWTPQDYTRARAVMPKVLVFARMLHDAGVPMMIGTDSGGGVLFDRELQLHRDAGIPLWDVLRMATSEAADQMKMGDRVGRVKTGYEADLAIFDADPSADVSAIARVHGVLVNGRFLRADALVGPAR